MQYAWFWWSLSFLLVWVIVFIFKQQFRKEMLIISLLTMPLGLTEPLFVPRYWNPPSLFNLAQKTGFDLESLIFCFSIGGICSVFYKIIYNARNTPLTHAERQKHHLHRLLLTSPIIFFIILSFATSLNPIYKGIIAMFLGALASLYCRPDLKIKIFVGGFLFTSFYFIFFFSLILFFPDYVRKTWNLKDLSGFLILGIPLEELLFAFSFGMLWSSLYEHLFWLGVGRDGRLKTPTGKNDAH
ncbi:MAG TPA: lycopene cyclase domain-containing protein [Gammaproteobacteria bacterium]|nr:lycopene cyclase domain-containing protein [Gammaproteobacteria bacterium]